MRNQKFEAILAAWWSVDRSEPSARSQALEQLNQLLDSLRLNTPYSREQLLDHLYQHYKE
jgi:hypothetical protein